MKKKTYIFLISFFFILILLSNNVYSAIINGDDIEGNIIKIRENGVKLDEEREQILNDLKNNFGYEGSYIQNQMILKPKISISEETTPGGMAGPATTYKIIKIGDKQVLRSSSITDDEIKKSYGWDGSSTEWDCEMIVSKHDEGQTVGGDYAQNLYLKIDKLFTGEDIGKAVEEQIDTTPMDLSLVERDESIDEMYDNITDFVMGVKEFVENFKHNKMGTIFTIILDGTVNKIDFIQKIANIFQTIPLKTANDNKIVYQYDFLAADGNEEAPGNTGEGAGNRNKYTNVSQTASGSGESWQKIVNIDINETEFSSSGVYGFSNKTEIPVIVVDPYTMATSKISAFDVNFLIVDQNLHNENDSIWIKIRNVWVILIRSAFYIASAILIFSLVKHGIVFITKSAITPKEKEKHTEGLINFLKSLIMLVGTVVIMACAIYANEMFLSKMMTNGQTELPIRVNVAEAGYSFSTTDTGYVRYMAQIENVDLSGVKFTYVLAYLALAIMNLLTALVMLIRTILMFGLALVGPIVVIFYALDKPHLLPMDYRGWAKAYISIASIQVVLAFAVQFVSAL